MSTIDGRFYARVCEAPSLGGRGWSVPYRKVKGTSHAIEAIINLEVLDVGARVGFRETVPFRIDTGSDVTIVPRQLLTSGAFRRRPMHVEVLAGLAGRPVLGDVFRAVLSIATTRSGPPPLSFGEVHLVVVDDWDYQHGMLGLDALRRVRLLADPERISFWEPGQSIGELTPDEQHPQVRSQSAPAPTEDDPLRGPGH